MYCMAKKRERTESSDLASTLFPAQPPVGWSTSCYLNFSGLYFPYLPDGDNMYPIPQRNAVKIKSDNICKLHEQMRYIHAYVVARSL